jgi:four helix bundle protein
MEREKSLADQLEERLIEFAADIVMFTADLVGTPGGKHIAMQMLRSGTAPAPNYAEARGAESRADFLHKLGIVQKELNETSVWLRILLKIVAEKREKIVVVLPENQELCRIVGASIRTAKAECEIPEITRKEIPASKVSRSIGNQ